MAVRGYLTFSLRARPGLFPTDLAVAFHAPGPRGVSRGIHFRRSLPLSLLNRAQPRASRQEARAKIQTRGQAEVLMLSLSTPLAPAFVIALLHSESLNYSALCNPSLTSNSPFSMVLASTAWLSPEKRVFPLCSFQVYQTLI